MRVTKHYKQPTLCGLRLTSRSTEPPVFCCTTPPTRAFPSGGRYCLCSSHRLVTLPVAAGSQRAGVRPHSAKWTPARLLIAKSARRRREIAMQTAGSGPDSPSTIIFAVLSATTSGHPGISIDATGHAVRAVLTVRPDMTASAVPQAINTWRRG